MGKIKILDLIETIGQAVVLKISEIFPEYEHGSDIDLLVLDKNRAVEAICLFFERQIANKGELKVTETSEHSYVDFLFGNKLEVRIDLIENFDFYSKFSIRKGFVVKIFKDCKERWQDNQVYYIPAEEDNLTIRYFEYLEYFEKWPNKVKHLEYICSIDDEDVKQKFFENTHHFIKFERKTWPALSMMTFTPSSRKEALRIIKVNIEYLIYSSLKIWIKKIRFSKNKI